LAVGEPASSLRPLSASPVFRLYLQANHSAHEGRCRYLYQERAPELRLHTGKFTQYLVDMTFRLGRQFSGHAVDIDLHPEARLLNSRARMTTETVD
jgi:hypothetical protein